METTSGMSCNDRTCSTRLVDGTIGFGATRCNLFGMTMDVSPVVVHGLLDGICWPKKVAFRKKDDISTQRVHLLQTVFVFKQVIFR